MRLKRATLWHVEKFVASMTHGEKNTFHGRHGRGVRLYLETMLAQRGSSIVLATERRKPMAFFGVSCRGELWLVCHPRFDQPGQAYAPLAMPFYRRWTEQLGSLVAYPSRWDRNVVRWYDELGFVEPSEAIWCEGYCTGSLIRVPGPRIISSEE